MPEITVLSRNCNQCFVDDSAGSLKNKYYCLPQPLANYPTIYAKFNCQANSWSMSTKNSNGISTNIGGSSNNIVKIENIRPACNSCGGLPANMNVFKFLMPKSDGLSQQMDYIIKPLGTSPLDVGYEWRNKTTVDNERGRTFLVSEYKTISGNWTTGYIQDLDSNMAKAPGSANAYGFYQPNHEFFSKPSNACVFEWTRPSGWSERANLGGTEADCRTFTQALNAVQMNCSE